MLTEPGGPFIDISKLNLAKYAQRPPLAKVRKPRERGGGGEQGVGKVYVTCFSFVIATGAV